MNNQFGRDQRISIPSAGFSLAADLTIANPGSPLIILVHGFAGNRDENGLFTAARDYLLGHGFSVLRFDHRGCGESGGSYSEVRISDLRQDLLHVIKYVGMMRDDLAPESIGLVGFSLGAATGILANSRRVNSYVFWSPAINTADDMLPRYQTTEVSQELEKYGVFSKAGLKVGSGLIEDLRQNGALKDLEQGKFRHNVLIVHGMADQRISYKSSEAAKDFLGARSRICLLKEADHSFRNDPNAREALFAATAKWFAHSLVRSKQRESQFTLFADDIADFDRDQASAVGS